MAPSYKEGTDEADRNGDTGSGCRRRAAGMNPVRRQAPAPPVPERPARRLPPRAPAATDPRGRLRAAAKQLDEKPKPRPRPLQAVVTPAEPPRPVIVDERAATSAAAAQQRVPVVDLRHQSPQREALARLPEAMARELVAIPVRELPGGIEVAVALLP